MKNVAILIAEKFSLLGTAGVIEMLNETNRVLASMGMSEANLESIKIHYISLSGDATFGNYQTMFSSCRSIEDPNTYDLIIVPPVKAPLDENIATVMGFVSWIQKQASVAGTEICSLCTGSFLLAESGLLEKKEATTHWYHAEEFKQRYPNVLLQPKEVIMDRNGIYMSGGATAFLNMILYLIEKHFGKDVSLLISKLFLVDRNKESQAPFTMFSASKNHNDDFVLNAQNMIEQNYSAITVEDLSEQIMLNSRSLNRRFKKALGLSPIEYIKRIKLEAAKRSLEKTETPISEIMYDIGYSDQKTFNYTFKSYTDLTPSEYRKRYRMRPNVL